MTVAQWFLALGAFFALGLVLFAIFEKRGMQHVAGARAYVPGEPVSLSYAVWYVGSHFPLSICAFGFLFGLLFGGLSVHFFWHWCPPGSISTGMLSIPLLGG